MNIDDIVTLQDLFEYMEMRSIKDIYLVKLKDSYMSDSRLEIKLSSLKFDSSNDISKMSFDIISFVHGMDESIEIYDKNLSVYIESEDQIKIEQPARVIRYNDTMVYAAKIQIRIIFE